MESLLLLLILMGCGGCWVGMCFWLVSVGLAPRLARQRPTNFAPSVILFKPLHGADPNLTENLRSFCRQDYPQFRLVVGISEESDPALAVVRQVKQEFPSLEIQIVTGMAILSANAKVANLVNMTTKIEPTGPDSADEIWIVSDGDVRVGKDWLKRIVAPFTDAKVGVASCFYRMADPPNLAAALEAFQVNTDFLAGILISERFFTLRFAMGAAMAVRKSTLDQMGGFAALVDYLADDYQLGFQAHRAGYRVVIADEIVDLVQEPMAWSAMWAHQLRWSRTYRACEPAGYFFSLLTNALLWPLLLMAAGCVTHQGWAIAVGLTAMAVRWICAQRLYSCLTGRQGLWKYLWLAPIRDGLQIVLWLAAFTGKTVIWRGRKFKIDSDGRMKEMVRGIGR